MVLSSFSRSDNLKKNSVHQSIASIENVAPPTQFAPNFWQRLNSSALWPRDQPTSVQPHHLLEDPSWLPPSDRTSWLNRGHTIWVNSQANPQWHSFIAILVRSQKWLVQKTRRYPNLWPFEKGKWGFKTDVSKFIGSPWFWNNYPNQWVKSINFFHKPLRSWWSSVFPYDGFNMFQSKWRAEAMSLPEPKSPSSTVVPPAERATDWTRKSIFVGETVEIEVKKSNGFKWWIWMDMIRLKEMEWQFDWNLQGFGGSWLCVGGEEPLFTSDGTISKWKNWFAHLPAFFRSSQELKHNETKSRF